MSEFYSKYFSLNEGEVSKKKSFSFKVDEGKKYSKRLDEKDSKTFNKAFKDFKKLVRDVAKSINIDGYIDDVWTNSEAEGKVIVDFDKQAPSQKVETLIKSLEDDVRVEKITKKGNGFVVIFKEKYRNLEEDIKNRKNDMKKKASLFAFKENSKTKSFKEFKKLKESRKNLSKRKLNESDSVTIEIDFTNYSECLRCIFKDMNENLQKDQLDWYTEVGMDMAIDPNSMYEWVRYEATLATTEEFLSDVFDKSLDDFSDEEEAVRYIIDNFEGVMYHNEIDGENLFLYVY